MIAYLSNEPFALQQQGIDYTSFSPKDFGFDLYSDILFTSQQLIKTDPKLVHQFYQASLQGWKYAMTHIDETIKVIKTKYNSQNRSKAALKFEAETLIKLIDEENIPLGYINPETIKSSIQLYRLMGLVKNTDSAKGIIYSENRASKSSEMINLTQEEQIWIKNHSTIRVASEKDYPPWDFFQDGKPAGYSIDYVKLLASKLGLKIEFVTDTWDELVKKIKNDEIDLIHTMYKNSVHKKIIFVDHFKRVVQGIYTHKDTNDIQSIHDLSGKIVSIPKGDSSLDGIQSQVKNVTGLESDGYLFI